MVPVSDVGHRGDCWELTHTHVKSPSERVSELGSPELVEETLRVKQMQRIGRTLPARVQTPCVSGLGLRTAAGGLKSSASPRWTPRNAPIMTLNQTPLLPLIGPGRGEGRGQHGRSHGPPTPPPIFRGSKLGERPAQELSQRQPTTAQNKQALNSLQASPQLRLQPLLDGLTPAAPSAVGPGCLRRSPSSLGGPPEAPTDADS